MRTVEPAAAPSTHESAVARVEALIRKSRKGIGIPELMEKTGFDRKKINNIVFRLKMKTKIRSVLPGASSSGTHDRSAMHYNDTFLVFLYWSASLPCVADVNPNTDRQANSTWRSWWQKKKKKSKSLYQIKVTLVGSKPPIWRRLIVNDNIRLDQLHSILQAAMGWFDYHLHQYRVGNTYIGIPEPDYDFDVTDERIMYLHDIISKPKDNFVYEYDFGDGWEHKIVLEKLLPLDSSEAPLVIKGKKACPPEDCGGVWGYYELLDAIQDPAHEEHESMLEWVGGEFRS